ncbi:T9SS type A sorting domain-containing protein [Gracilimonas tropica]|uniref:T9SS type A sorting domain-containing protein n=1 Tax=Gracilimonas tropica TaxID=454600 RepID=UPI00037846B5|nr:T9SS type A sorting domain-containing protein [Gracilimonas tropica]
MKRVTILFFALLFVPILASAQQNWEFDSVFPDSANSDRDVHGIAVDPDGKIWIQSYYPLGGDSVYVEQTGDSARVTVINVFNPDGTKADISPIKIIPFADGTEDTVGGFWNGEAFEYRSGRGLATNHQGDIVAAFYNTLYLIDYETGEGLAKVESTVDDGLDGRGAAKPAVDGQGNVFVSGVFPGDPIIQYNPDLTYNGVVIDESVGFSRGFEVSEDGNTIWWAGYDNNALFIYQRPSAFEGFDQVPDTALKGMRIESFDIHPVTKYLWVSAGSPNDPPNQYPGTASSWRMHTWYAFDYANLGTEDEVALDSLSWNLEGSGPQDGRPRAIDFSPDGTIAYVGQFNQPEFGVQKFTTDQVFTSNENEGVAEIPKGYELDQNYPNPFNPTTNINYSINEAGPVTLKVYDMTGREVATLVNERMSAGSHQVTFDASNLSSGVYLYSLQANGVRLTNKMTLIK